MEDRWLYAWGLGSVALGGASLIVPLYVVSLGGSAFTLGVLASSAAFVGAPAALFTGPLADRTGRHRELVIVALLLIATMLCAIPFLDSISAVIVANAVIWLSFAGVIPVATLLAVVGVPEARWTDRIARLNTFQGAGWAGGLLVGAAVTGMGMRVVEPISAQRVALLLYAVIAGGAVLAGLRSFPHAPRGATIPDPRRLRRAIRQSARFSVRAVTFPFLPGRLDVRGLHPRRFVDRFTPNLAAYFVALFLFFAGFAAFFAPLPAFLTEAGFAPAEIFGLYVLTSIAAAVFFARAGRLASRHGLFRVQAAGLVIRAAALPLVAAVGLLWATGATRLLTIGTLFAIIGLSWALIVVTAGTLVTQLSPPTVRGEALGVYSALMAVSGGVGSIIGGRLAIVDYAVAFGVAGGLVAVAAVIVEVLRRRAHAADAGPVRAPNPVSPR